MSRQRKYTQEMKTEVMDRVFECGSVGMVAEEYNVPLPTLNNWLKKRKETPETESDVTVMVKDKKTSKSDSKLMAELQEERDVAASLDQRLDRAYKLIEALKNVLLHYWKE